jgi:predicted phage replisome organizer
VSEKHFYWLKLQTSFFESDEVKVIEEMENGSKYVIFWLKLLLKAVAQLEPGQLRFKDDIPYTPDLLSTVTDTDIDIVRSAMQIFERLGMIRLSTNGDIFIDSVKKMCGSESIWAKYKRQERLSLDNVQSLSKNSPIELDIELEIDKETQPPKRVASSSLAGLEVRTSRTPEEEKAVLETIAQTKDWLK